MVVLLALPLGALSAPRPKEAPEKALYFPTATGTTWVYETNGREYEEAITESKAEGKGAVVTVVRTEGGRETWRSTIRVSAEGVELIASGGVTYDKPCPWLRAGAKPGEEWEYEYSRTGTAFHNRLTFIGFESVETPAGKYEGMRLECLETIAGLKPNSRTDWYVRGVGLVKRTSAAQTTTLKRFTPGK